MLTKRARAYSSSGSR